MSVCRCRECRESAEPRPERCRLCRGLGCRACWGRDDFEPVDVDGERREPIEVSL